MKTKFIAGLFIFTATLGLAGCSGSEKKAESLEPINISVSDKREDGSLTMVDPDGNNYLQFNGIIHIESDGSNGKPIKIMIYQNESEDYEFE